MNEAERSSPTRRRSQRSRGCAAAEPRHFADEYYVAPVLADLTLLHASARTGGCARGWRHSPLVAKMRRGYPRPRLDDSVSS